MKNIIIVILTFSCFAFAVTVSDLPSKIEGLDSKKALDLMTEIKKSWDPYKEIDNKYQRHVVDVMARSVFNGEESEKTVSIAKRYYKLVKKGAPLEETMDIMEMAYNKTVTDDQLLYGAKALEEANKAGIDENIYYEMISHGMIENWSGKMILEGVNGLVKAKNRNLSITKAAIAIMITFDVGLENKKPSDAVESELKNLGKLTGYDYAEKIIKEGVPSSIVNEIYQLGVDENWKQSDLKEVLKGLTVAKRLGLTIEKVALAMVVRMEQGLKVPAAKMVEQELKYVMGQKQEQKKRVILKKNKKTAKRIKKPVNIKKDKIKGLALDTDMLNQSIMSFYKAGTPYLWGGNTRKGTDCSGFTSTCYKEQGIVIPRVSRHQYKWLKKKRNVVNKNQLKFGDLVFFNSNGYGRITHVGMYYKDGKFVHSCSSKGVTFTKFDKRYYQKRFAGAGRIAQITR